MGGFWFSVVWTFVVIFFGILILGGEKEKEQREKTIAVDEQHDSQKQKQMSKEEDSKIELDSQLIETVIVEKRVKQEDSPLGIEKDEIISIDKEEIITIAKDEQIIPEKEEIVSIEKTQDMSNFEEKNEIITIENNVTNEEVVENSDDTNNENQQVLPIQEEEINIAETTTETVNELNETNNFEQKKCPIDQINQNEVFTSTEIETSDSKIIDNSIHSTDLSESTIFVSNHAGVLVKKVEDNMVTNPLLCDQSTTSLDENHPTNQVPDSLNLSGDVRTELKQENEDSEWHFVSSVQP